MTRLSWLQRLHSIMKLSETTDTFLPAMSTAGLARPSTMALCTRQLKLI